MNNEHLRRHGCRSPRGEQQHASAASAADRARAAERVRATNQQRRWHTSPPPPDYHGGGGGGSGNGSRPEVVQLSDASLEFALISDGYRIGSTIGQGSYSKVRLALRTLPDNTAARVACKVIDKRREPGGSYVRKFLPRELDVLCAIRHPNIVNTHRIYVTPSTVHVIMDYCEGGDLLNYMLNVKTMPQWQALTFFK